MIPVMKLQQFQTNQEKIMNKNASTLLTAIACLSMMLSYGYAQNTKLAQTGFQFLSVTTDARPAAMGEAFTAISAQSSSIFYNPANVARMDGRFDVALSGNKWIADIQHFTGALAFKPKQGVWGTFAVSMHFVDYGEFIGTVVDPNSDKGYLDTGTFTPSSYAVGIGYSKMLSDQFAFGIHAKYTSQSLGNSILPDPNNDGGTIVRDNNQGIMAFDFGTVYLTGFKSLAFAMSVRNFASEVQYETEGFQLPLIFNIGFAMDIMDLTGVDKNVHSLMLSLDATHPRSAPEQIKIGGEYTFLRVLALRFGYAHNFDERGITAGIGLQKDFGRKDGRISLDYAYTPFGLFDEVQRFSFRLSL